MEYAFIAVFCVLFVVGILLNRGKPPSSGSAPPPDNPFDTGCGKGG